MLIDKIEISQPSSNERDFVMDFEKVSSLHNSHDIPFSISKEMHAEIFNSFDRYDKFLSKFGLLSAAGYWQVLLDKDRNPANKPPWGGMAKIDLVSGKKLWDIPQLFPLLSVMHSS